eukprot:TRINITY_DN973_c0_g5_i1.p1 TRINITY_DN973_c0_g5~~TRINITY_DN973_c0_g5_i1.p1  ORF type:complete len:547 (-),score=123.67 TRINITY_DN973_c0_g5_i1:77-1717(-)
MAPVAGALSVSSLLMPRQSSALLLLSCLVGFRDVAALWSSPRLDAELKTNTSFPWPAWLPKPPFRRHGAKIEAAVENSYGEVRQKMLNYHDTQYTSDILVGGQKVKAIVDTGSFELLVFGVNCTMCGTKRNLYDKAKSPDHWDSGFEHRHSYGSGTTQSREALDVLAIGPLEAKNQAFWEVYDANMPILREDSFASIFGVGPPATALTFAKKEAKSVHDELDVLRKSGTSVTPQMLDIVKQYDDAVQHAENSTSVVENLNLKSMSVCLGRESGSDGIFVWNDTVAERLPSKFLKVDNVGSTYWAASLTGVKLSKPLTLSANTSDANASELGCREKCYAVIDTGTSLIAAPPAAVKKLDQIFAEWQASGGSCDDLSKLPNLEFYLNGQLLTLPPQSYVGRVSGNLDTGYFRKVFPHLQASAQHNTCMSLLMAMDVKSDDGDMWILGMPFFREYYTTFTFERSHASGRLVPSSMQFSVATADCDPGRAPGHDRHLIADLGSSGQGGAQLNVDAAHIRGPSAAVFGGHDNAGVQLLKALRLRSSTKAHK